MLDIYVARHGQDLDNANGILNGRRNEALTDLGMQQARDVARKMLRAGFRLSSSKPAAPGDGATPAPVTLSAIYSSPLKRSRKTAEIFLDVLSGGDGDAGESPSDNAMSVEVLDDLIERDFGVMTGKPTSSILEICGADHVLVAEKINYFLDPPGAETFKDLVQRANRILSRIRKIAEGDSASSILLVTHGDFGKMLYAAYYNLQWEEVLTQFHFGNSEVILLSEGSPPEKAHVFETAQFNS